MTVNCFLKHKGKKRVNLELENNLIVISNNNNNKWFLADREEVKHLLLKRTVCFFHKMNITQLVHNYQVTYSHLDLSIMGKVKYIKLNKHVIFNSLETLTESENTTMQQLSKYIKEIFIQQKISVTGTIKNREIKNNQKSKNCKCM